MTIKEAIKTLKDYNAWRRDDLGITKQIDPKKIGMAIDTMIEFSEILIDAGFDFITTTEAKKYKENLDKQIDEVSKRGYKKLIKRIKK